MVEEPVTWALTLNSDIAEVACDLGTVDCHCQT